MSKKRFLTELEERLAGAEGHELKAELDTRLGELDARLSAHHAKLLPRDESACVGACVQAARAARKVIQGWAPGTAAL